MFLNQLFLCLGQNRTREHPRAARLYFFFRGKERLHEQKEKGELVSAHRVSPGHVFHTFVFLTRWAHFQNVSPLKIGKTKTFIDVAECTSYLSRVANCLPRTLPNKLAHSRSDLGWRHADLVYSVHLWY